MLFTILGLGLAGLAGCDIDEGPGEELREATEAIRNGEPASEVIDELGDVVQSDRSAPFDEQLDQTDAWLARQRKELKDAGKDASKEISEQLDAIDREVRDVRAELAGMSEQSDWEKFKAKFDNTMHDIAESIDKVDGEVDHPRD